MAYTDESHEVASSEEPLSDSASPLTLQLRERAFPIKREVLMNLPESILLCLFPNGLVLKGQAAGHGSSLMEDDSVDKSTNQEDEVIHVDFDPDCLEFVLSFFRRAAEDFYGPSGAAASSSASFQNSQMNMNPLATKQAIIVLREELDFYGFPPKNQSNGTLDTSQDAEGFTNFHGLPTERLLSLKRACGEALLKRRAIFAALGKTKESEEGETQSTNVAEQHLIDMLCASGFSRNSGWSHRAMEPQRACITSIALVLLRKAGSPAQLQTAQKLLLFWRKPARKCWWDSSVVELVECKPSYGGSTDSEKTYYRADPSEVVQEQVEDQAQEGTVPHGLESGWKGHVQSPSTSVPEEQILRRLRIKTWARRVWTLELSLI